MQNRHNPLHNIFFLFNPFSHEIEKFARNTGLKLFRTSVKENLNVGKVFQHLSERHVEAVSRWSDETEEAAFRIGGANNHRDARDVR